jgi:hypothetical protein
MSRVSLSGNALGTGTFTIASPNSNTDRTLNLPDNSGTVLTTATPGVPVNGPAFSAFRSGTQAIAAVTWTKVACQNEEFDTNGSYDNATNYRFQPATAGYYQVSGAVEPSTAQTYQYLNFYKNGSPFKRTSAPSPNGTSISLSALIYLNGSTDYVEMYVLFSSAINLHGFADVTFFQAALVRAA